MRGTFITGTDTGIGKTLVTAGIVRALRRAGVDAVPAKPVQTGCIQTGSEMIASDLEYALLVSGVRPNKGERDLMSPFRYRPACSPHLAGRLCGEYASTSRITDCLEELRHNHDHVIAEGAGGVRVPLNESKTMLDLMVELEWPVLLVASGSLGTINHTLMSLEILRNAGLSIEGVVLNHCHRTMGLHLRDNPAAIEHFGNTSVLAEIPYNEDFDSPDKGNRFWKAFDRIVEIMMCVTV